MPDPDHQIMTCPECLTEFEGNDQDHGEASCPKCGTMAEAVNQPSLAKNVGNGMPLPVPKKSINIDLPEMIIRNANPKRIAEKPRNIPSGKLQDIGNTPKSQSITTRKYARNPINWEAGNDQENTHPETSGVTAATDDANTRFKRTQRRHKYSGKVWIGFLLAAALLVIAALAILPPRGVKSSNTDVAQDKPPAQAISGVQKPVEAETPPAQAPTTTSPIQKAIKKHGVRGAHEKASAVVRNFLEAKTLDERRNFTRSPQRVEPLMTGYYKTHDPGPIKYRSLTDQYESAPLNDYYLIGVTLDDLSTAYAIVAIEEDRFLVDWESFVAYSEMSLGKFMEEKPAATTLFRVRVKPDDYYNFNFTAEQYQCLRLSNIDQTTVIYGYVMKGEGPISSLQPGQEEFFTLRLRYPENPETANQVIIDEVIASGWVIE